MARIFITGSADGLGHMAAKLLIGEGHKVVLHARSKARAKEALDKLPGAETVLAAELGNLEETKNLAAEINSLGGFDAIIHNAGVYRATGKEIFAVNTLAPYVLTCLVQKPKRLIYLSSGMHTSGDPAMKNLSRDNLSVSYSDSKLHDVILALAAARRWPDVYSNAVDPGWVPTKMGGPGAPDDLDKGYETQAWLAVSDDKEVLVSGRYFYHKKEKKFQSAAGDLRVQEKLLSLCEDVTGVSFP